MTALALGTQRPEISDPLYNFGPQKGSTIVFQNGLVMTDASGFLRPAAAGVAGSFCVGIYDDPHSVFDRSDATGLADGVKTLQYKEGVYGLQNDGTNPILSTTRPGTALYSVDDQTVSLSSLGGTRPPAGRFRRLDTTAIGGPVVLEISESIGAQLLQQSGVVPENVGPAIASAATIAPTFPIHHVTGTVAINTITPPPDFLSGGGTIALIPDAIFTTGTSGNIAIASTAVVSKTLYLTYDPGTSKWYPGY